MKNILINNFGRIVHYRDFVEVSRTEDDELYFRRTDNQELAINEGSFNRRIIGVHKTQTGKYVIGAAICNIKDKTNTSKTGLKVVISRIIDTVRKNGMSILPKNRGVTAISKEYLSYLTEDPYTYSNISGPLGEEDLTSAISILDSLEEKFLSKIIEKQKSICFSLRKKELHNG